MKVEIANPIYDVVFKYMMEDNTVAKLLVSSIIGEEVVSLEPKPQEQTAERTLSVCRFDFWAKIKTPEDHKLIILEIEKASVPSDIKRFRTYMYMREEYVNRDDHIEDEKPVSLPIYTIYFLGGDLKICDTPVLSAFPDIRDVATQQFIEGKNKFIGLLNHRCWIVQTNCLKQRRRTELEKLLSVFDQDNRSNDHRILHVNEKDFPAKYRPLIRRLKKAASNVELKEKMDSETRLLDYLKDNERYALHSGFIKGLAEGIAERLAKDATKIQEENVPNANMEDVVIETISRMTGLTPEQITEILNTEMWADKLRLP